jgi:hypothetical protein
MSNKIEIRRESNLQFMKETSKNLVNSTSANGLNVTANATTIANSDQTEEDKEKKIINEFVYLLDKSRQLFNGLK